MESNGVECEEDTYQIQCKMFAQHLELIKVRLIHHWIPVQWPKNQAFVCETKAPEFRFRVQGHGWALSKNPTIEWNSRPKFIYFRWLSNLERFMILM